ncbi:MAG: Holliday junction resolvase RuvX [Candidatus Loosdrechtia sp.]|uniref:RuvX/YqgF family protein n=1 Tax=Candidatus Loosdrechtia sp. TaxID=3101272 RepID=UPI003A703537|nr:MAG: Holliday junction resolvase RuvX [Candidatus Jettenia sp. AMX2]
MRILGIDYGEKRIGLALSDPLGITAQGLTTIERTHIEKDLQKISDIIHEKGVEEIVIGLPKRMDNTLGDKAHEVIAFTELLQKRISIPVKMADERLSTVKANRAMLEGDLSRKKRKVRIDMIAAQLILQSYLDGIKK